MGHPEGKSILLTSFGLASLVGIFVSKKNYIFPNHPPPAEGMLQLRRFLQSGLHFTGRLHEAPESDMLSQRWSSKKSPLFPETPRIWTPDEIKGSSLGGNWKYETCILRVMPLMLQEHEAPHGKTNAALKQKTRACCALSNSPPVSAPLYPWCNSCRNLRENRIMCPF